MDKTVEVVQVIHLERPSRPSDCERDTGAAHAAREQIAEQIVNIPITQIEQLQPAEQCEAAV